MRVAWNGMVWRGVEGEGVGVDLSGICFVGRRDGGCG